MKKAFCTGTLAVSLLLGAARAADLFLNTDTATGFLLSGSVWTRYWLMAPVVILAWLAGLYVPRKQPCGLRPGAGVWMSGVNFVFVPLAFCSELYGFLTVLNVLFGTPEQAGRHQTAERILLGQLADVTRAALFVVFGVWCLLVFLKPRPGKTGRLDAVSGRGRKRRVLPAHSGAFCGAARQPVPHPTGGGDFFRAGGASVCDGTAAGAVSARRRRHGAGTQPLRAAGFLLLHLPCTAPGRMAGDERRGHAGLVSAGHHAGMHGPAGRGLRAEHCQAGMIL